MVLAGSQWFSLVLVGSRWFSMFLSGSCRLSEVFSVLIGFQWF